MHVCWICRRPCKRCIQVLKHSHEEDHLKQRCEMAEHHLEKIQEKSLYARRQVELFLYEEERSLGDERSFGESSIEEIEDDESESDGNNTETQKKLGIDINMIGARKEALGKTRSETKALSSPRNESMERADLTMEDWIQETCLISALISGPTEPKSFQEAWHYPIENERNSWRAAIRKDIKSMIETGVWRKTDRKKIPNNRRLIGNKWVFKIKEMVLTEQD